MLCLTCGYPLGSAQETDKEETHEGRVGDHYGSRRGPGDLEADPENGGRSAAKGELRPVSHRGNARVYRAPQKAVASILFAASLFAADPPLQSRIVQVGKQDFVQVYSTYNYSTVVVLPDKEEIKDVKAGEENFWAINSTDHTVSVKPKLAVRLAHKKIDPTNINIEAVSGNVYSVVVSEVSGTDHAADVKVILEQRDAQSLANIEHPKYVRADYADELKVALAQSKEENAQIKKTAAISEVKDTTHDYEWKRGKESESFGVKGIWHDSRFTYIEAHSQNAPALYEVDGDGKESVVQYNLVNGKYVVQHIIEHGRLKAGKKQLEFDRVKESV